MPQHSRDHESHGSMGGCGGSDTSCKEESEPAVAAEQGAALLGGTGAKSDFEWSGPRGQGLAGDGQQMNLRFMPYRPGAVGGGKRGGAARRAYGSSGQRQIYIAGRAVLNR